MGNQLQVPHQHQAPQTSPKPPTASSIRIPRIDKQVGRVLGLRSSSKKHKLATTDNNKDEKARHQHDINDNNSKIFFRTGSDSSMTTTATNDSFYSTTTDTATTTANGNKLYDCPTSISFSLQETMWIQGKPVTTLHLTISGDAMNGGKMVLLSNKGKQQPSSLARDYRLTAEHIHRIEHYLIDMGCREKCVELRGRMDSSTTQGTVTLSTKMVLPGMHHFLQYHYDAQGLPASSTYKTSQRCIKYCYDFWLKSSGFEGKSGLVFEQLLQFIEQDIVMTMGQQGSSSPSPSPSSSSLYCLLSNGYRDAHDFDSDSDSDDE